MNSYINQRGFTMIEMVAVLILMAIFATVVATRLTTMDTDMATEAEILKANLRFAQIKALNNAVDDNTWGIHFINGGTSYTYYRNSEEAYYLNKDGDKAADYLPGECGKNPLTCTSSTTHDLPTGMTIHGSSVDFNRWGSPGSSDILIVLKKTGLDDTQVTVTKNTGYIP